jgi:phage tail-like protein
MEKLWWNSKDAEPKRNFRWKLQFTLSKTAIPPQYIKSVKKPSFTFNSKRIQGLGYAVNVAQQAQYQPVEITFIDDEANTITNWIYEYFYNSGINFNGLQGAQTCIDTEKAKRNADNIEIQMVDAEGNNLEIWVLHNAWISSFSQSDLNYESNDLATYTMTFTYDWFDCSKEGEKALSRRTVTDIKPITDIAPKIESALDRLQAPNIEDNGFTTRDISTPRQTINPFPTSNNSSIRTNSNNAPPPRGSRSFEI